MSRRRKNNHDKTLPEKESMKDNNTVEVNETPKVDKSNLPQGGYMKDKLSDVKTDSSLDQNKHESKKEVSQQQEVKPQVNTAKSNLTSDLNLKVQAYLNSLEDISDTKAVASAQYGFFKLLKSILRNSSSAEFHELWTSLLNQVNKSKHLFTMSRVNLAPHSWLGSEKEATTYRRLVWVILETMEPSTRFKDLDNTVNDLTVSTLNPVERNNLLSFYG